jgi:hypothetical protein
VKKVLAMGLDGMCAKEVKDLILKGVNKLIVKSINEGSSKDPELH